MASEPKIADRGPATIPDIALVRLSVATKQHTPLRSGLERARRALHDGDLNRAFNIAVDVLSTPHDGEPTPEVRAVIGSVHAVVGQFADGTGNTELARHAFENAIGHLNDVFDFVWDRADHIADFGIALLALDGRNAETALRRAIELGEDTVLVRRYLGLSLLMTDRLDEAGQVLSEVVRRVPDDWRAHVGLARIAEATEANHDAARSWLTAAEILSRDGLLGDALEAYRSAERLAPSADGKLGLAGMLSRFNEYAEALRLTSQVLADDPGHYRAKVLHLEALLGSGDASTAVTYARRLTEVAPDDPVPHAYLGIAHAALGEHAAAVAALSSAHQLSPDSAQIAVQLADVLNEAGDPAEAREVLDAGIERSPRNVLLLFARAHLALITGDLATAEADVTTVIGSRAPSAADWVYLGEIRLQRDDFEGARAAADQALELSPDNVDALVLRGDALERLGARDEQIETLSRARELDPGLAAESIDSLAMALLARATDDDHLRVETLGRELIEREPDDPGGYFLLGEALLALGRLDEAGTLLDEAADRIPADPVVDWLRAEVLGRTGQLPDALAAAERAASQIPDKSELYALIGALHERLAAQPGEDWETHIDAAMTALNRAIELNPDDLGSLTLLGQLHAGREEYEPAKRLLTKAVTLAGEMGLPVDPVALADLGRVEYLLGDSDEALRLVTEASELDDSYENAWVTKGEVLYGLGRYAESVDVLRRAADMLPQDAYVLSALGESYRMLKAYDEADDYLNRALDLAPDDAYALASRGAVRHAKGDEAAALDDLTRANDLAPSMVFPLNNHLQVMLDKGQTNEAIPLWVRAVDHDWRERNPGMATDWRDAERGQGTYNVELRSLYADTLRLAGRNRDALPIIEQVLRDCPEDLLALRVYGRILLALDRLDEAMAQFARAAALDPQSAEAVLDLVDVLRRKQQWREALTTVDAAIERMPGRAPILLKKAGLYERLALWDKAIVLSRQAVELTPEDLDAHMSLAWSLLHKGEAAESLEACRRGVARGPQNIWARKDLGNALWETGHREEALREFQSVVDRSEAATDNWGMHALAWALMCLGEHDRAAACFNRELAATTDPAAAMFDLGLNSLAAGHVQEGLEVYADALATVSLDDPGRAIGMRGPLAVAIHDLRVAVDTGRVKASADTDSLLRELTGRLAALPEL